MISSQAWIIAAQEIRRQPKMCNAKYLRLRGRRRHAVSRNYQKEKISINSDDIIFLMIISHANELIRFCRRPNTPNGAYEAMPKQTVDRSETENVKCYVCQTIDHICLCAINFRERHKAIRPSMCVCVCLCKCLCEWSWSAALVGTSTTAGFFLHEEFVAFSAPKPRSHCRSQREHDE